jgi:hypothetical protein
MFQFIRHRANKRKLRLFACACCRRIWELLLDERSRKAVEVSERYADDAASKAELSAAQARAAEGVRKSYEQHRSNQWPDCVRSGKRWEAAKAAKAVARATDKASIVAEEMGLAAGYALNAEAIGNTQHVIDLFRSAQAHFLRDIFGNPFLPVTINPAWLARNHGTVSKIAQAIYDERAFDRMPILADALEEAGCTSQDILNHCRQQGEHVRGCWVVDAILGKT